MEHNFQRRVDEWEDAGSSTAGASRKSVSCLVSHRALSGELAPLVAHACVNVSSKSER